MIKNNLKQVKSNMKDAENKTNHMKIPRCVFKKENLITLVKKPLCRPSVEKLQ